MTERNYTVVGDDIPVVTERDSVVIVKNPNDPHSPHVRKRKSDLVADPIENKEDNNENAD